MTLTSKQPLNIHQWILITLVFFGFMMSATLSRTVFERLPHLEDEVAYLFQARVFARGDIVIETPQPRRAYWQPFVIDHEGLRFSKYTPGWSGLLSIGVILGQPWIINAFFTVLTIALVYRLGTQLFSRDVGLIASAFTAVSPMALLLNASLMGHTSALFFTTLFIIAYRKIETTHRVQWGMIAGISLGFIVILRPLTAIGIGTPFIVWSAIRVLDALFREHRIKALRQTLAPLLVLSAFTLAIGSTVPLYNHIATGDATRNLYTFVWDYDQLGFGECCGRNGHTLERAVRHTRFDLSLTAADVFGWQIGDITQEIENHWLLESDYFPNIGLSFVLLPFGILIGFMTTRFRPDWRSALGVLIIWCFGFGLFASIALDNQSDRIRDMSFAWLWIVGAGIWLLAPLLVLRNREFWQARWTWLLLCVALGLILAQMTYWIGSQRYSTRYYFEGLTAFSILSALPIAYAIQQRRRFIIYLMFGGILIYSLLNYSLPRVNVLHGFNEINQALIDDITSLKQGEQPMLVLVGGESTGDNRVRWRSLGTLMILTSPYLDSEIVGAWYYDSDAVREQLLADYPNHQVLEMYAQGNSIFFVDNTEDSD